MRPFPQRDQYATFFEWDAAMQKHEADFESRMTRIERRGLVFLGLCWGGIFVIVTVASLFDRFGK